jgi:hypothetical protein
MCPDTRSCTHCMGEVTGKNVLYFSYPLYLDRTNQGLKPRFLKGEPPSDADIADVVQNISRRVIRKLRQLGYLEPIFPPNPKR